jgi:proteasome assembly chaperone (PAC2) family protein
MAGLLPGLAKLYDLEGACLLVETPGTFIDAKGAVALVSLLGKIAGEKFDVSHLDVRAKKTEALLKRFGEQAARAEEGKGIEAPVEDIMKRTESLTYIR